MNEVKLGNGAAQFVELGRRIRRGRTLTPVSVFSLSRIVLLAPSTMRSAMIGRSRESRPAVPCGNADSRNITPSFWVTPMVPACRSPGRPVDGADGCAAAVDRRADPADRIGMPEREPAVDHVAQVALAGWTVLSSGHCEHPDGDLRRS